MKLLKHVWLNKLESLNILRDYIRINYYKKNQILSCPNDFYPRGLKIQGLQRNVRIDENVSIGWDLLIIGHNHDYNKKFKKLIKGYVHIKEGAWIGSRCTILQGNTIGENAILGAGSVLTKSIPANEIWAGNPAKKIGTRKNIYL